MLKSCGVSFSDPHLLANSYYFPEQSFTDIKLHNNTLALSLVSYLCISVTLLYYLKKKHKKEKLLEVYTTETRISKKMHDEVANEIYTAINYISDTNDVSDYEKSRVLNRLNKIYTLTRDISRETGSIDTGENFVLQLKHLLYEYSGENINVIAKGIDDINWQSLDNTKKIATYRALQEIMVNMKKHSRATVAFVNFSLEKSKVIIKYSDNGRGVIFKDKIIKNGLQNVENRMDAIGGIVNFETNAGKGFHVTFLFPA